MFQELQWHVRENSILLQTTTPTKQESPPLGSLSFLMFESPLDSDSSQCRTIDAQIEKMWNLFLGQQKHSKTNTSLNLWVVAIAPARLHHKSRQRHLCFQSCCCCTTTKSLWSPRRYQHERPWPHCLCSWWSCAHEPSMKRESSCLVVYQIRTRHSRTMQHCKLSTPNWWCMCSRLRVTSHVNATHQMRRMRLANAMSLKTLTGDHITRSFSSRGTSALIILAIGVHS